MPRGVVLNFHREENANIFEDGIVAVKKRYTMVGLPELQERLSHGKSVKGLCHISVDDGEKSFYNHIFPVLKRQGVPASLFVSPKIIANEQNFWFQDLELFDGPHFRMFLADHLKVELASLEGLSSLSILKCLAIKQIQEIIHLYRSLHKNDILPKFNMNLRELLEVHNSGLVTVGAHTQDHPILMNETSEDSYFQITSSIEHLGKLLDHPIYYFAYPNGVENFDFTEREVGFLEEAGIRLAFTTRRDHLINTTSIFKVPRTYYATSFNLQASHPLIMWRLALGNRWPQLRHKKVSEIEMRRKIRDLLHP